MFVDPQSDAIFQVLWPLRPLAPIGYPISVVSRDLTTRDPVRVAAIYRNPQDVRTVIHLERSGIVLALLLLISVSGNFYQYYRGRTASWSINPAGGLSKSTTANTVRLRRSNLALNNLPMPIRSTLPLNTSSHSTRIDRPPALKTVSALSG
jgi:hypothetical protein